MKTILCSLAFGLAVNLSGQCADSVLPQPGLPSGPSDQPYPPDKNQPEKDARELPRDNWRTNTAPGFGIPTNSPALTNNWPVTNNWPPSPPADVHPDKN